jgi:hypothetical protein
MEIETSQSQGDVVDQLDKLANRKGTLLTNLTS